MGDNLMFAVRGSDGLSIRRGILSPEVIYEKNDNPKANLCRVFQFSNSGQYFCYCDSTRTVLIESTSGKELMNVDLPRTQQILFSPKDRLMVTYEPYTVYGQKTTETGEVRQPSPNLRLWSLPNCVNTTTLIAQKHNSWEIQWTDDEVYSVRLFGSEILIHKYNSFDKYESKLVVPKVDGFALSPGSEPHHLAVYIPPFGGKPAVVQLRRLDHKFTMVANKTFFKCDRASMLWNCKGSGLVIMSSVDVDQSNLSYYGEQNLYFINVNGDSCMVSLAKKGPIYSVKWNPSGKEFAVCYGFMPAHVTLYNLKGESTFDLGEGARNEIFYNRFGNILLVCGFGNIAAGKMEFWNVDERKEIIRIEVANTTFLEWAPDGQHFITATTTPRLRIDNCFRIWHYTGRLVSETFYAPPSELWQVKWRPISDGVYNRFAVCSLTANDRANAGLLVSHKDTKTSLINNLPAGAISKQGAYVPPHLRKNTGSNKGALNTTTTVTKPKAKPMSETEKKIRNIQKKLDDIVKLKQRKESGETLEANQLQKIDKEAELMEQLEKLMI